MKKWDKFILAPDSFKGSLSSLKVCEVMEKEIRHFFPYSRIIKKPMADGGEGTVKALVDATGGDIFYRQATDPLGRQVKAFWGVLGDKKTAVIEMAAASGLELIPYNHRNPLYTTTYGTGELIASALEYGCSRIIIGIGGSATNDGGAGMAQALGFKLKNKEGKEIGPGGKNLLNLNSIDIKGNLLEKVKVEVVAACDVNNPLCGPEGASFVYAPQKGAGTKEVGLLDKALAHFASIVKRDLGVDISHLPGSGAAGGLGGGLAAFLRSKLLPGVDIVLEYSGIKTILAEAEKEQTIVLTGEGEINCQTIRGKVPSGVARAAKSYNLPVVALTGRAGKGAGKVYEEGVDAIIPISQGPQSLADAISDAESNLKAATSLFCRLLLLPYRFIGS